MNGSPCSMSSRDKNRHWHWCVFISNLRTKQSLSDDDISLKESSKTVLLENSHVFGRETDSVKCLLNEHEDTNLVPQHTNKMLSMMPHTCNPSMGKEKI